MKRVIERHQRSFAGAGVGWADTPIILAATKAGARVHTADRDARRLCAVFGVALA